MECVICKPGKIIPKLWKLPKSEPDRPHGYKYRLAFISNENRIVGYDNERGKGEHRHILGNEEPYCFVDVKILIKDFVQDMEQQVARMERSVIREMHKGPKRVARMERSAIRGNL